MYTYECNIQHTTNNTYHITCKSVRVYLDHILRIQDRNIHIINKYIYIHIEIDRYLHTHLYTHINVYAYDTTLTSAHAMTSLFDQHEPWSTVLK